MQSSEKFSCPPISPFPHAQTPPTSPFLHPASQIVTLDALEKVLVKITQTVQKLPNAEDCSEAPNLEPLGGGTSGGPRARASRLEYKSVNEVWDEKAYNYKIEESPEPLAEVKELDEYVFVLRARIDKKTGDLAFYIDIKSVGLRDILRTILKDVRGVSLREDKPAIEQNLLYNYLPELEAYQSNASERDIQGATCLEHLNLLIEHIKTTYTSTTQHLLPLLESGEITYDLLWALFKPNAAVYTTCFGTGKPRCVKYDFSEEKIDENKEEYYKLECRYLDFNGKVFGEASIELRIPKFRGSKRIHTLKAFPLQYHPDESAIMTSLTGCGRKFVSLMGTRHRHCRGEAFYMKQGVPVRISVDSRVMIDVAFFRKINPNYSRPKVDGEANPKSDTSEMYVDLFATCSSRKADPDQVISKGIESRQLKERDLLLCCPTVPGFSFGDKLWVEFAVADITEIKWSSTPFDCLTIPNEQKDVIMALAETRMGQVVGVPFDDFVTGKGRGLNVLVHGPPGVGKTLTAEAVAEHLRRPLYSISAGELHGAIGELESKLSKIFQIAHHWGALLLLDEADVFLAKRSLGDVYRNGLVSVFLRRLEYCEGILFLTTNRVSEFDEAVLSRIHLMLRYDELNGDAKRDVWGHFLERACTAHGAAKISKADFDRLVRSKFNGRQIKNVVATAHALATKADGVVKFDHLRKAVTASEKFIREFNGAAHVESIFL